MTPSASNDCKDSVALETALRRVESHAGRGPRLDSFFKAFSHCGQHQCASAPVPDQITRLACYPRGQLLHRHPHSPKLPL